MKKSILFLVLLVASAVSSAQVRYIYVPGDGEHRWGITLGTGLPSQELTVGVDGEKYHATSPMSFRGGIFWGYEAEGNMLNFGNYGSLTYSMSHYGCNTFAGNKVSHIAHSIHIYEAPFLSFPIGDQLALNLGIGFDISYPITGRTKYGGASMQMLKINRTERTLLTDAVLDANIGAKYYLNDNMFIGARLQYGFFSIFQFVDDMGYRSQQAIAIDTQEGEAGELCSSSPRTIQLNIQYGFVF